MDKRSVEVTFSISPETNGQIFWQSNTLWFRPIQPYNPGVAYQAHLLGEVKTAGGEIFNLDRSWQFTSREPDLIYFVPGNEGGEIWRVSHDGTHPQQLSFTNNNVYDFSVDRSSSQISFSVMNESSGEDLWLMDRNGEEQRLLLNCSRDLCSEPAWSMDSQTIAYTREVYQEETDGYQPAQVWTMDINTDQTTQLYQSNSTSGHSPTFSPDGKRFAFYDSIHKGIRVLDLETSQSSIIPRSIPGSGDWSPDGTKIIFTDLITAENEPFVKVFIIDLETNVVENVLIEGASDTDYSQPRWSPDGERVAVSLRPVNANISKELWVLRLDGLVSWKITDDQTATFSAYLWDPWGERLVYQRYELGTGKTSIWLWENRESRLINGNGARPQWLP